MRTEAFRRSPLRSALRAATFTLKELFHESFDFESPKRLRFSTPRGNFSSFVMYIEGARDPSLWRFISSWVGQGDSFVDVGANIGTYAVPAASLVGGSGFVVAFEAHPMTFLFLQRSIQSNGLTNVRPLNKAVSDRDGTVRIAYNPINPGETHISTLDDTSTIAVEAITLDGALAGFDPMLIRYLKIDVEGFEMPVLRGCARTLSQCARLAVQTEINQKYLGTSDSALEEFFSLLSPLGYQPYRIDPAGRMVPAGCRIWGDIVWMRPAAAEEAQKRNGTAGG